MDAADALELLSPAFLNKDVRRYAVSRLACASSEQILMFLPQLVQALKYEAFVCEDMSIVGKQSEVGVLNKFLKKFSSGRPLVHYC